MPENTPLQKATTLLLSHQFPEGYWWYTLEANESINAELVFLLRYLGIADPALENGIANRLIQTQNADGSWPLYFGGPGDLSTTIECYLCLKMVIASPPKANEAILPLQTGDRHAPLGLAMTALSKSHQ